MGKKAAQKTISVDPQALAGKKVIITGEIPGQSRKSAEQILTNAGATIEKSLNKSVELVVLGEKAGPQKLEKIEKSGVETKEWDELIAEIGNGDDEVDNEEPEEEEVEEEAEKKPQKTAKKATTATSSKAKVANPKTKASVKAKSSTSSNGFSLAGKSVIITGAVPGHDRKSSQKIVEDAGATVAKSLNKSVELAILGAAPGPDKLLKIEAMGIETIEWNDMAEKLGLEVTPAKVVADVDTGEAPNSIDGLTVIISGAVDGHTRTAAQKILEGAGATYAKSLNKSVELVVLGANPGPDKLNKIADLGIPTCSFEELVEKLGLDTKAPPKKKQRRT